MIPRWGMQSRPEQSGGNQSLYSNRQFEVWFQRGPSGRAMRRVPTFIRASMAVRGIEGRRRRVATTWIENSIRALTASPSERLP